MADSSTTAQKIAAEALGTFVLVLFGCGSVAFATQVYGGIDVAAVGLTFGLTVAVLAYAVGRISGGHFNPAVSVGAAMGGRMAWRQVPVYVGSQVAGAVVAGFVLWVVLHGFEGYDSENAMGQNAFGDLSSGDYAWWAALLLELVLTALFVIVILGVTDERFEHPALAPLAIGLTLAAIHFVAIPATGTSVNPARSIGPALFAGTDAILQLWVFILAPLAGGIAAGAAYPLLFGRAADPVPGSGMRFAARAAATPPEFGATDQFQQEWNQQQAATEHAAWEQEPIIQDGWQWDHAAQEWKPLEQWQPAQPAVTDPSVSPGEQPAADGWGAAEPDPFARPAGDPLTDGGDDASRTQVRPE